MHKASRVIGRVASIFVVLSVLLATPLHAQSERWWNHVENDRRSQLIEELAQGADPNVKDESGLPAIMFAIQHQSWDAYELLRQHRQIDVNAVNAHDETPLMYLAILGETARMQQLIKQGAEVRRLGWTPLHYAASKGNAETAQFLLKQGALVNAPAPDGTSPLMMAALSGDRATVELLLKNGADASAVNLQQLTAADWARSKNNTRIADYLENYAKGIHTPAAEAPTPASGQVEAPATEEGSSGSRYFDLDRFN
ncbi:MAG TPA: ankyrin repeat domain-containing protein [Paenalcaligenes sp.]|nr:ankyrin repeat domain-containing protein [Paenalcaligenes sp.]